MSHVYMYISHNYNYIYAQYFRGTPCIHIHIYTMQTTAEFQLYGIDWDAFLPTDDDVQIVSVPMPTNPLTEEQFTDLQVTLPPVIQDSDYGLTQYFDCVRYVLLKLRTNE